MPLPDLDTNEKQIVRACLCAAVEGPFFPDWEFHALFGLEREELKSIFESWPDLDEHDERVVLAINNSFCNLLGYPHGLHDNWSDFIPVNGIELARIYMKWKSPEVQSDLDGLM